MGQSATAEETKRILAQVNETDDPRQSYSLVLHAIRDLEERGETVPTELLKAHRVIALECHSESQGR